MKKEKVKIAFYGVTSLILIILIIRNIFSFHTSPKIIRYETYIVHPGDTLWSIVAGTYAEVDIREVIYIIRQKNEINPTIYPGQELLIPVLEK